MQTGRNCAGYQLGEGDFDALADFLGDSPGTVIFVHSLRRRLCKAFVIGCAASPEAAAVQIHCTPSEPTAYGHDPESICEVLRCVEDCDSVSVNHRVAQQLAQLMESRLQARVRRFEDVWYALESRAADFRHHDVRELIPDDVRLLEAAPPELRGCGFGSCPGVLAEGVVACGIVSGRVVSTGFTSAVSGGYADIGVYTAPGWRRRGFGTACVSLVANRVQAMGLTPVWSTSDDNIASIRIADKLGFERVSSRACLVLEK